MFLKKIQKMLKKAYLELLKIKIIQDHLYFYTSKLNKSFSDEKKLLLIEVLWEVILSDNEIHDFEVKSYSVDCWITYIYLM